MESPEADIEVVGGIRPVQELLASGRREVYKLLVAKGRGGVGPLLRQAERLRIHVEFSARSRLDSLCPGPHQGVVALVAPYLYRDIDDLVAEARAKPGRACLLALDRVEDPMNLGAIIRVAGAFGAGGVVISKDRACGVTPTVVKASAGAIEHVAVARVGNLVQALEGLKDGGFWVVGTAADAPERVDSFDWDRDVVVVLGSEGRGIRPLVASACDASVAIPLAGPVEALNVAASAAVICYEIWRQRKSADVEKQT